MSSYVGKRLRLGHIFRRSTGRTVIIAVDHGRRYGPISGIERFRSTIEEVMKADIDALLMTPAMLEHVHDIVEGRVGIIARIDGTGTRRGPDETDDRLIATVDRALKIGADAVAIMVYLGCEREVELLEKMGMVADICDDYGMPLVVEAIPREPYIKDPNSVDSIAYSARICAEYGADVIKTTYVGTPEEYKYVIESVPVPIVIRGGAKVENTLEFLKIIERAIKSGARGVAIGRNVFQYKEPSKMAQALCEIVHKNATADDAYALLG